MANHMSHAGLPFPVRGARYTVPIFWIDSDGDPTDPVTPDTELSKDGAAFADRSPVVQPTIIAGSNGSGYLTLGGDEMDCSLLIIAAKVASGPKATLAALTPRVLPVLESGTATAGAAGSITLAAGAASYSLVGAIVRTTGGAGGGGTGGANNQARMITAYNPTSKVATVAPNWETNPDATTTYEVLSADLRVPGPQPLDAAGTRAAVGLAAANLDTQLAAPATLATDALNASALAADAVAEIAAAVGSGGATADEIAAAVWDLANAVETGMTPRQALRAALAVLAGKVTGGGTGTEIFRAAVADTKPRLTVTDDAAGNRSAITYDLS